MPFFLYEATDHGGKPTTDFQDAATARAAYDALMHAGLRDIRILDSQTGAAIDDAYLRGLSEQERREYAEYLMRFRQAGDPRSEWRRSLLMGIRESIIEGRSTHIVLALVLLFCLWQGIWLGVAGVVLFYGVIVVQTVRALRWFDLYQEMQMAQVAGQWQKALSLITRLRTNKLMLQQTDVGLDFEEAAIRARQGGDIERIIAGLAGWRERLADDPGAFESRSLGIYIAGGHFDRYLKAARQGLDALPEDPSRRIDLALAEARFGSAAEARSVLNTLEMSLINEGLLPFRQWIEGLIAVRSGDNAKALSELWKAMSTMRGEASTQPPPSVPLALVTGAYCLALARSGRKDEAVRMMAEVRPLLRLHGYQGFAGMMQSLQMEVEVPDTVS
ncbi:MAG: hypothetical protein Q7T36_11100 [Fluviicoccus sp.]|uniref:tetratricopeptide repeat protein n=1 Tax=Fluviicoccus sp. TaxID=2003552 RepID=UPI00271872E6|nr:hypothetical protein [Fluviicoccus sp.]MDO8331004.1 hypothetical protein [Fluviicoccus sp.]